MPAGPPLPERARHLAGRARRAPRKLGRVARRTREGLRRHDGPALSVVMPVYNVGGWVRPALESVLAQTLRDLEVVVVDDGSTDQSMAIVEEIAARDERVRIVHKANAGLGAARNTGTEHARGEFLAFADSDDLVMPDAYRTMVERLRASGSDFVTGPFERGDETETIRPVWVSRTMRHDRTGISIRQEPDLLLDITAWNKVFRRSWWDRHDLAFDEGVRYEDQVPITRAYLTARSFDVVSERVYVWRTRLDGSSITQQKTSTVDLVDRLRSQRGCAELVRDAPEDVRRSWYRKLLGYDLPNYTLAVLHADEEYAGLLIANLESLRDEVPEDLWRQIAFRNRAMSWALSHGHLDVTAALQGWFEQSPAVLETGLREDGTLAYQPPFEHTDDQLPPWLLAVHDGDVNPKVVLTHARWEGDELVLRGSAYLMPVPPSLGEHHLRLELRDGDEAHEVLVTRHVEPLLDVLAEMSVHDMGPTGFEARIDAAALGVRLPGGARSLGLRFTQEQLGWSRHSGVNTLVEDGSAAQLVAHEVADRSFRFEGRRLLVDHPADAADLPPADVGLHAVEVVEDGLRLTGTAGGPQRLRLSGPRVASLPSDVVDGDFDLVLPLAQDPWGAGPGPMTADTYRLVTDDGGAVRVDADAVADLPLFASSGPQHVRLGVSAERDLLVGVQALDPLEGSAHGQHELRQRPSAGDLLPVVLCESFGGATIGDSPAALARELARRGSPLSPAISVLDLSQPVPEGTRPVVRFSAEWHDLLRRASHVVNNANFPFFYRKAPGQTYLQTWHGTPLKKIANDIADQQYFSITYQGTMAREAGWWDHLVSPSPYCSEVLPRAFGYAGPLLELGYPRNDALLAPDRDDVRADVRRRLGIAEDAQVLLYAPTWRESARTSAGYGKVLHLRPDEVADALPGTVVLVRGHANTSRSDAVTRSDRVVDVTLYPDVNDLFLAADVLVTDYSSVMFDFSVLDRPMLFLVPDLADYGSRMRGFYVDLAEVAPGPLCADQEELLAHLREGTADSAEHRAARAAFRERFAPWDDGGAAARVVDAVLDA